MEPKLDSALQAFIAQQMGGGAPGMRPAGPKIGPMPMGQLPGGPDAKIGPLPEGVEGAGPLIRQPAGNPYLRPGNFGVSVGELPDLPESPAMAMPIENPLPEDMVAPGPAPTPPALGEQGMVEGDGMPQESVDPLTDIVAGSIDAINSIPRAENPRPAVPGEQVYQSWQRFTGRPWPGGRSQEVVELLKDLGITAPAGSMEANLALQKFLQ